MSNAPMKAPSTEATAHEVASRPDPLSNLEALLAPPEVKMTFGRLESRDGVRLRVRLGADLIDAQRAKGCLVEPQAGDTVLVARSDDSAFVLSVLVGGTTESESVVTVDGDLTLRSKHGRVAIVGNEGVSVTSGGEVAVNAPTLTARTMTASLFADTLSYLGRRLDAHVDRVKVVGHVLETAIDHVSSRVKHSFRVIDEIERVKAKELHVNAEATLNLHGKNTLMTAEKLVKLDGEQICIG